MPAAWAWVAGEWTPLPRSSQTNAHPWTSAGMYVCVSVCTCVYICSALPSTQQSDQRSSLDISRYVCVSVCVRGCMFLGPPFHAAVGPTRISGHQQVCLMYLCVCERFNASCKNSTHMC